MSDTDPFNLQRFAELEANGVYEQALSEIKAERVSRGLRPCPDSRN